MDHNQNDNEHISKNNKKDTAKQTCQIYTCEIIQDLLPLYQDSVCSASSKTAVEEHLAECSNCQKLAERLKSNVIEKELSEEKDSVLMAHSKKERKQTFTIGLCFAGILMIPVIVCLICNLAIGHALDWFFIVLASLLLTASITVVPLMVQEKRGLWTLSGFVVSLLLLLLSICIYTQGHWFFLAAVPTMFGLSVIFMPYILYSVPLPEPFTHCKGFLAMLWDTLWLYATITVCGLYSSHPDYWRVSLEITSFCLLLPWALFLIIRYSRLASLTKAGVCTLFGGIFGASINSVIALILRKPKSLAIHAGVLVWNDAAIDTVTSYSLLLVTIPAGIALVIAGCVRQHKQNAEKG